MNEGMPEFIKPEVLTPKNPEVVYFRETSTSICILDSEKRVISANDSFCEFLGKTKDEVVGRSIFRYTPEPVREYLKKPNNPASFSFDYNYFDSNDKPFYSDWSVEQIDKNIFITGHNTTELKRKAFFDSLTGIYNRAYGAEFVNNLDVTRENNPGILLFDLDDFKKANTDLGHLAADQLLIDFADILKSNIREGDIVFRLGGDEFAIVFPDTIDNESLKSLVERLRDKADEKYIKFSCGFATLKETREENVLDIRKKAESISDIKPPLKNVFILADDELYRDKEIKSQH